MLERRIWSRIILNICEEIGYGRVMQIAADAWREKDPVGALTIGPAVDRVKAHRATGDAGLLP